MDQYRNERTALIRKLERMESIAVHDSDDRRVKELRTELLVLETDELRERASGFGIDLVSAVGPWETDDRRMWLPKKEQNKARRLIADTRFEWWKKWISVLSPVVSVVIALLAFMVAVLALYLQLKGKFPSK
jgi:hypothetical protein